MIFGIFASKKTDKLLISIKCIFFMGAHLLRTPQLSVFGGSSLRISDFLESFHEWGQNALEGLVLVCGASI